MNITIEWLDEGEILRYLGLGGKEDASTLALVRQCIPQMLEVMRPRGTWRLLSLTCEEAGVRLESGLLLPGTDLRNHLASCTQVAVMACTLSAGVDALLRRTQAEDLARALVLDACANAAIEAVCDQVEGEIKGAHPGCHFPFRFSPGYGDLPIQLQQELLTLVDGPRRIGLCATGSHILSPGKSVTALLGIGTGTGEEKKRDCASCNLKESCLYRKAGASCIAT